MERNGKAGVTHAFTPQNKIPYPSNTKSEESSAKIYSDTTPSTQRSKSGTTPFKHKEYNVLRTNTIQYAIPSPHQ